MIAPAPGIYLAMRRAAAGLTIADVAARIGTEPHIPEHRRVEWIASIETNAGAATIHTLSALRRVYPFSFDALAGLAAIADGEARIAPRLCRICACSEPDPCIDEDGNACSWSDEDLCSDCDPGHFVGYADPIDDGAPCTPAALS